MQQFTDQNPKTSSQPFWEGLGSSTLPPNCQLPNNGGMVPFNDSKAAFLG